MNLDIDFDIMREPGFYNGVLSKRKSEVDLIDSIGYKLILDCPICKTSNGKNKVFLETEFGNYRKCIVCSCLYLDKISMRSNVGRYSSANQKILSSVPEEKKREYRKQRFGNERLELIENFSSKPLSKLSLLDVGCNTGFFIEKAKEFMNEVCGLEVEKTLVKCASKKTGCRVYFGDISSVDRKFDVITLFDTIEHLEKPAQFLKKCSEHLNDEGLLVIFTPNYKSAGFDILKEKCNHICPGHLVLFCKETCYYIEKELGFEISQVFYETAGMDIFDVLAYERDINCLDIKETILYDMKNVFQEKLNSTGYANSLRLILRKGEI